MKPHKHAELIKQWADGAEIEWYSDFYKRWSGAKAPVWNINREYRVKPKVKWKPKHMLITAYMNSKHKAITVPKKVHTYDTIQQFVNEFETDWDNQNHEVYKSDFDNKFTVVNMCRDTNPTLGVIRMSEKCARKLCDMLNNKEIEL